MPLDTPPASGQGVHVCSFGSQCCSVVFCWAYAFRSLRDLVAELQSAASTSACQSYLQRLEAPELVSECVRSHRRLFVFDYEGVLAPRQSIPELGQSDGCHFHKACNSFLIASMDPRMRSALVALSRCPNTSILVYSVRSRAVLEAWLRGVRLPIHLFTSPC